MALLKKSNQPGGVAELQAQHKELSSRAGAVAGQLARLDPVNDWELASRALAEQSALERALGALAERIEAAQIAERAAGREAQDAAQAARAVAARARLDAAARAYGDALQRLPLAELDAAKRELGAVAGWPSPAAGVVIGAAAQVIQNLERLRYVAPTWCGLPEPPTKHAQALAEARAALERAKDRLAAGKKLLNEQRNDAVGPTISTERMAELAAGVDIAQRRLAELQA